MGATFVLTGRRINKWPDNAKRNREALKFLCPVQPLCCGVCAHAESKDIHDNRTDVRYMPIGGVTNTRATERNHAYIARAQVSLFSNTRCARCRCK